FRRWALWHVSLLRRLLRGWCYCTHEIGALGLTVVPRLMRSFERLARSHAKRQIPKESLRRLTPTYSIGCKRVLLSTAYLASLARPNVQRVTSPIVRAAPGGLVTDDGTEHQTDVVIFATGFQATDPYRCVRVEGRGGLTLSQAWNQGIQARLGMAVAGFP